MTFPEQARVFDADYLTLQPREEAAGSDVELVALIRAGRAGATDALFEAYGAYVERLLARVMGFDPEVEDLLHDVFAEALSHIDRLREPSRLKPWLTRLTVNVARTSLRKRQRHRRVVLLPPHELSSHAATSVPPEARDLIERVFDVLHGLRPNHRLAFSLRYIEGMTLVEAAEALEVSLATFKRWLKASNRSFVSRAKKTDRALYEELIAKPHWRGFS